MMSDRLESSMHILVSVAKNYVDSGLKAKAEAVLKDLEICDLSKNRWVCRLFFPFTVPSEEETGLRESGENMNVIPFL